MLREGFAGRSATFEADDRSCLRRLLRGDLVLGGGGFELLELQLHLVEQAGAAFRAVAVLLPP